MKMKFILASLCTLISMGVSADYTTTESETLQVWYTNPIEFVADNTSVTYLTVYQHDEIDYSAFNMYFVLPEGLRVNKIKMGRDYIDDITLSERASYTHSIACNIVDGTQLKIFCDSNDNSDLYNTDENSNPLDELFTVGLVAAENMQPGEYPIYLTDIKFAMNDGNACIPSDMPVYGTLKVVSPISEGINNVGEDAQNDGAYFNLQGIKVNVERCKDQILIHNGKKIHLK